MIPAWCPPQRIRTLAFVIGDEADFRARLARVIVELRALRGMSQATLAERVERSEAALSRWETGKATPSAYDLHRLAEALEVPVDAFEVLVNPPNQPLSPIVARVLDAVARGGRKGLRPGGP